MKTIVLIAVLGTAFLLPAQINNGGGGASTNPTSGVEPVKSGSVFIDSPESVSGGNVTNTGTYTATGFICSGANCYIDTSFAAAPANPTSVTRRLFSLDGAGYGDLDSNGNINYIGNLPFNPQTGTTYTVLATDAGKLVTFSNAGAIAVTLPQASVTTTSGFFTGRIFRLVNVGSTIVTITPTTSTINGAATYKLFAGNSVEVVSDGTNYQIRRGNPAGPLTRTCSAFTPTTSTSFQTVCSITIPANLLNTNDALAINGMAIHSGGVTTAFVTTIAFGSTVPTGQNQGATDLSVLLEGTWVVTGSNAQRYLTKWTRETGTLLVSFGTATETQTADIVVAFQCKMAGATSETCSYASGSVTINRANF